MKASASEFVNIMNNTNSSGFGCVLYDSLGTEPEDDYKKDKIEKKPDICLIASRHCQYFVRCYSESLCKHWELDQEPCDTS